MVSIHRSFTSQRRNDHYHELHEPLEKKQKLRARVLRIGKRNRREITTKKTRKEEV